MVYEKVLAYDEEMTVDKFASRCHIQQSECRE